MNEYMSNEVYNTTSVDVDDYYWTGAAAAGGGSDMMVMNDNTNNNAGGLLSTSAAAAVQQQPMVDFGDPSIAALPKVLLMGPRRSGKTSIQRVVFQKMSPHETLFRLEATQGLERALVDHTPLCRFTIWDFPGDYYGEDEQLQQQQQESEQQPLSDETTLGINDDPTATNENIPDNNMNNPTLAGKDTMKSETNPFGINSLFAGATSLIFVVDAQDEPYTNVLESLTTAVTRALRVNPNITIEVFINKVDGELFLSDDSKYDCRRDVMSHVTAELTDAGVSTDAIQIRYHITSIYDHSIYEALSRVVQRLIPQLPTLENLLNVLVATCSMEKAYLFDVVSKLYISTDSGPVDMQSVELCSDMIDVVLDVSGIYGLGPSHEAVAAAAAASSRALPPPDTGAASSSEPAEDTTTNLVGTLISQAPAEDLEEEMVDPDSAYDSDSASVIRLSNGMVLYLKEVDTMLALVCITRSENFRKKSLINYNIGCLKKALQALAQPPPTANGNNKVLRVQQPRVAE